MGERMWVRTPPCCCCGRLGEILVSVDGYAAWRDGTLIQDAMPELAPEYREQLMTGTHPACWDAMFGNEEEDDAG